MPLLYQAGALFGPICIAVSKHSMTLSKHFDCPLLETKIPESKPLIIPEIDNVKQSIGCDASNLDQNLDQGSQPSYVST